MSQQTQASQIFQDLKQNVLSSDTFLVGFKSSCEWFVLMSSDELLGCKERKAKEMKMSDNPCEASRGYRDSQ